MITFENVSKVYPDGTKAVEDINLTVEEGEFVCLIGPSGCGKTTTMKLVNRLHEPTSGSIKINGTDVKTLNPVDLRRTIGYVIQQVGLFPHMTIEQNVELVPKLLGWPKEKRKKRVEELLPLVGLDPELYRNRYPKELSGGQQQRVGVIRALAAEPAIILMDEPFGALDPITREVLQDELKRLQSKLKKTILFVTHDMDEALKLADRIVIMKDGRIHQVATPDELLRHPKDEWVAQFLGKRTTNGLGIADVMIQRPVTAEPTFGLYQGLATMRKRRVNSLLITDEQNKFLGLVTFNHLQAHLDEEKTVGEIMQTDYPTVTPADGLQEAFSRMLKEHLDHLPVVDEDGTLVGLITATTMVDALAERVVENG